MVVASTATSVSPMSVNSEKPEIEIASVPPFRAAPPAWSRSKKEKKKLPSVRGAPVSASSKLKTNSVEEPIHTVTWPARPLQGSGLLGSGFGFGFGFGFGLGFGIGVGVQGSGFRVQGQGQAQG